MLTLSAFSKLHFPPRNHSLRGVLTDLDIVLIIVAQPVKVEKLRWMPSKVSAEGLVRRQRVSVCSAHYSGWPLRRITVINKSIIVNLRQLAVLALTASTYPRQHKCIGIYRISDRILISEVHAGHGSPGLPLRH